MTAYHCTKTSRLILYLDCHKDVQYGRRSGQKIFDSFPVARWMVICRHCKWFTCCWSIYSSTWVWLTSSPVVHTESFQNWSRPMCSRSQIQLVVTVVHHNKRWCILLKIVQWQDSRALFRLYILLMRMHSFGLTHKENDKERKICRTILYDLSVLAICRTMQINSQPMEYFCVLLEAKWWLVCVTSRAFWFAIRIDSPIHFKRIDSNWFVL